jgi:hypothetical protein
VCIIPRTFPHYRGPCIRFGSHEYRRGKHFLIVMLIVFLIVILYPQ